MEANGVSLSCIDRPQVTHYCVICLREAYTARIDPVCIRCFRAQLDPFHGRRIPDDYRLMPSAGREAYARELKRISALFRISPPKTESKKPKRRLTANQLGKIICPRASGSTRKRILRELVRTGKLNRQNGHYRTPVSVLEMVTPERGSANGGQLDS